MRTGLFITARLKSTRLPLKLLARVQGKEVIRHVIARAKQVRGVDRIVLCTSTNPQDMPLTDIAIEEGVSYYCGDPDDVLVRLKDAGIFFGIDNFISVTADNPLFCVYHANQAVEALRKEPTIDYLYFSNLPIGAFVYALRTKFLHVVSMFKGQNDTEIWGPYVNRPELFNVKVLTSSSNVQMNMRLTLDLPEDLEFIEAIAEKLGGEDFENITLNQISMVLRKDPEIKKINSAVTQASVPEEVIDKIGYIYRKHRLEIERLIKKSYEIA